MFPLKIRLRNYLMYFFEPNKLIANFMTVTVMLMIVCPYTLLYVGGYRTPFAEQTISWQWHMIQVALFGSTWRGKKEKLVTCCKILQQCRKLNLISKLRSFIVIMVVNLLPDPCNYFMLKKELFVKSFVCISLNKMCGSRETIVTY